MGEANQPPKKNFRGLSAFLQRECQRLRVKSSFVISSHFCFIKKSKYSTERSRILIVIPKKIGNAPYRNYLRRCTKEVFYKRYETLPLHDYTIVYKPTKKNVIYDDINVMFSKAFDSH